MTAHDHYYAIKWTILFNTILGQACDVRALDTFDLGADVGPDKFVTTFSEYKFPNNSNQEKIE